MSVKWIFLIIKSPIDTGNSFKYNTVISILMQKKTRGSVGWACVAHLSFCFEETLCRTFRFIWESSFRGEDFF